MIYKVLVGNEHGGAARSSMEIINNFINNENFAVIFLCNGEFSEKFKNSKFNNVFIIDSFAPPILTSTTLVRKIINQVKFIFWIIFTSLKFIRLVKNKKVRYIHTTNNHALLITLIAKKFKRSLFIISHWRCVGLASSKKYYMLLNDIDVVICISNAVKQSLPILLQLKSKIIYDGIDVKTISDEGLRLKGKLRNNLQIRNDEFIIGTIGTFSSIKCHDKLIDSLTHLSIKNLKVILFGSCPNSHSANYLKFLKEKVNSLGLENQVYFLMDSDYLQPKNFIIDFDFFVGTTWNSGLGEGFGLIYAEAMAQKLPVVAINVGAANEIIVDKKTGFLINSNDPKELAEVIQYSYNNRKIIKSYGENGFKRVSQNFDIHLTIDKLATLYKDIVKC